MWIFMISNSRRIYSNHNSDLWDWRGMQWGKGKQKKEKKKKPKHCDRLQCQPFIAVTMVQLVTALDWLSQNLCFKIITVPLWASKSLYMVDLRPTMHHGGANNANVSCTNRLREENSWAYYFVLDRSLDQRWERPLEKIHQPNHFGSCGWLEEETLIKAALNCNQQFFVNIPRGIRAGHRSARTNPTSNLQVWNLQSSSKEDVWTYADTANLIPSAINF